MGSSDRITGCTQYWVFLAILDEVYVPIFPSSSSRVAHAPLFSLNTVLQIPPSSNMLFYSNAGVLVLSSSPGWQSRSDDGELRCSLLFLFAPPVLFAPPANPCFSSLLADFGRLFLLCRFVCHDSLLRFPFFANY
jgi:hypothetical protein